MDLAKMRQAPGETIDATCPRLLQTDRTVMDAYAATQGLSSDGTKPALPDEIRTHDLGIRNAVLYPAELRPRTAALGTARVGSFSSLDGEIQNPVIQIPSGFRV